jgi:hypothetical protein
VDPDDQQVEFHTATLRLEKASDFKIQYKAKKATESTHIELLTASEKIKDAGGGKYFSAVNLFNIISNRTSKWKIAKISNRLPQPTSEWHFKYDGEVRNEMEFEFNFAMVSKNRPEGKFEFQVDGNWQEIPLISMKPHSRSISEARQEWVQDQLTLLITENTQGSNPFFHPKQEATREAIKAHADREICDITYVGLDDAANFFSSIFELSEKGVDLSNLNVSLRYAKNYDVNTESTWLEQHPRVEDTTIESLIHGQPWVKTDLIIDTYTIGEWFVGVPEENYKEQFKKEIGLRKEALNTSGKIILVYPIRPTPLCAVPGSSVLEFFDDKELMKSLDLKVIQTITTVGAAKGYVLEKIERNKNKGSEQISSTYGEENPSETASAIETLQYLQVVSDFNALREVLKRRNRTIQWHMESTNPQMMEMVNLLTAKLYEHEGPDVIVVAGPPGIRKTTMVASALLPNEVRPEWSNRKQPSILVGTPKAAWDRRGETNSEERLILFLDDLQDHLDDICNICRQETGSAASALESTRYFLKHLTGYAAVIVTWKSEREEDEEFFRNSPDIHCIDMHVYNDIEGYGSAESQANAFITKHFSKPNGVMDFLNKKDEDKFQTWIKELKECLILILSDYKYRCLESYVGCNELKKNLENSIMKIRRQSSDLDPFMSPIHELNRMLEQSDVDPFDKKGVRN